MSLLGTVDTDGAPHAIGPYSQAVVADGWVFCSGQIALDPADGKVVGGDVALQTDQVMRNLAAVLQAGGASLATVVKTTVFLVDMADFAAMNEVWDGWVAPGHAPARATGESKLATPDYKVEIIVTAVL